MFHVPRSNPRLLDDQFIDAFPALGLTTTSNSGAYWGDGDARALATDYSKPQYALESKARFSKTYTHCRPKAAELQKAMTQLRVRNRHAIRLFLVYNTNDGRWGMSIPTQDVEQLEAYGFTIQGEAFTARGVNIPYTYLNEECWQALYDQIAP